MEPGAEQFVWSSYAWRVISDDPDFPTEDTIVAYCSVADPQFNLPADPANTDCTAAFQAALDAASAEGGGTVFVPAGHYRFDGNLSIASNVTLRGRWRPLSESQPAAGSILKIFTGHGDLDPNLSTPFINISSGGGVRDLTFWHPMQDPSNVVPYPFVIKPSSSVVDGVTFVNAYQGIKMLQSSMCFINNIQGTVLHYGFYADQSAAISRFDRLNFGPEFWRWADLDGAAVDSAYQDYMLANSIGIDIRDMDGFYMSDCKVRGMNIGLLFDSSPINGAGPSGGYLSGIAVGNCVTAFHRNAGSATFLNSSFHGTDTGIQSNGSIGLNSCDVSGGNASVVSYGITATNCAFNGVIDLYDGNVTLINSDFTTTGTDLILGSSVDDISIVGCRFSDGPDIIDNSPGSNTKLFDPDHVDGFDASPPFPPKDLTISRKPGKFQIFDITEYGATADDGNDDSEAFGEAIDAANANDGGIVFIPNGAYEVAGSYTLSPGVELRGTSGSLYGGSYRWGDRPGSLLLITGNEGNPDGPAFLNLSSGCGIRGITFHYNSQSKSMLIPETIIKYPYTIRATGDNIYISDIMMSNPYRGIHFYQADNHLVENCKLGGLNNTILVEECTNGRIGRFHLKVDFWRDLWLGDFPVGTSKDWVDLYTGKYLTGIWMKNSTNEVVHSIFNHTSHNFIRVDNTSAHCFMVGCEVVQNGIRFGGNADVDIVMGGLLINMEGDRTGTRGYWADDTFTATANLWNGFVAGTPGKAYSVESGTIVAQQMGGPSWSSRGNVSVEVGSGATLKLLMTSTNRKFGTILAPDSTVLIQDTVMSRDLPNALLHHPGASLERVFYGRTYISTSPNSGEIVNDGMILDPTNLTIEDSPILSGGLTVDHKNISGARTSDGDYRIDVVDPDFINGASRNVTIDVYLRIDTDCTVSVYYDSTTGRKHGKTSTFSGIGSADYESVVFSVSDAQFDGVDDIVIEVTDGTPAQSPFSPMLNSLNVYRNASPTLPPSAPIVTFDKRESELKLTEGYANLFLLANVADWDGTISRVECYLDGEKLSEETSFPFSWDESRSPELLGLSPGDHVLRIRAVDDDGVSAEYVEKLTILPAAAIHPAPLRIEAEDYDYGRAGISYFDTTPGNIAGSYRSDDVDIEICGDIGGGYNVGYLQTGEWLEFALEVPIEGTYLLDLRYASDGGGGLHAEVGGVNVSGNLRLPGTGGWQEWSTVATDIFLPEGKHKLRIVVGTPRRFNLNWIEIRPTVPTGYALWERDNNRIGSGQSSDPDGNGKNNRFEYLFGMGSNGVLKEREPSFDFEDDAVKIVYTHRGDVLVDYDLEVSPDLVEWIHDETAVEVDVIDNGDGTFTSTLQVPREDHGEERVFYRVSAEERNAE